MGEIDILITPTIIDNPPLIKDVDSFNNWDSSSYIEEILLLANFTGAPSLTVPNGKTSKFISSVNVMGDIFKDQDVLNVAKAIMGGLYE
jgi:aspartyl-tRNA(Asn)/glutamyl-tRNA(Gln) amidotransferase subunit A